MSMGVYIKGMEMPKEIDILFVYPSGKVFARAGKDLTAEQYEAIEILPHGRLIDAEALHSVLRLRGKEFSDSGYGEGVKCGLADAREFIRIAPTIIEAES